MIAVFIATAFTGCGSRKFSTKLWANYEIKTTDITAKFPSEPIIKSSSYGISAVTAQAVGNGVTVDYTIYLSMGELMLDDNFQDSLLQNYTTMNMDEKDSIIDAFSGDDFYQTVYSADKKTCTVSRAIMHGTNIVSVDISYIGEWNDDAKAEFDKYFSEIKYKKG